MLRNKHWRDTLNPDFDVERPMTEPAENTVVGHMCYHFANDVECMSQVRVNPESGEFDASRAFNDMLDFCDGDDSQPESESLVIGTHRLAVARRDEVNAMLLRVVDLAAFRKAVAVVDHGTHADSALSAAVRIEKISTPERPVQRPRP